MSTLIDLVRNAATQLLNDNNGISEVALFQTVNRQNKFPGNNLYFTISRTSFDDPLGLSDDADIHAGVECSVDENGNFPINSLVKSTNINCLHIKKLFEGFPERSPPVLFNFESFLNRRLRAGALSEHKEEKLTSVSGYRKPPVSIFNKGKSGLTTLRRGPIRTIVEENEGEENE